MGESKALEGFRLWNENCICIVNWLELGGVQKSSWGREWGRRFVLGRI